MKGNLLVYCLLGILLQESRQLRETTALQRINSSQWTSLIRNLATLRPIPHVQAQVRVKLTDRFQHQ